MSSDDLQQKLINAKNQREQEHPSRRDPRELLERKKYHAFYNRIYPLLMKSNFDFAEVADVAGLKERRMRDALLSRLALDNLVRLVGHHPGSCYICGSGIRGFYTEEPLCMSCLKTIDTAVHTLYFSQVEPQGTSGHLLSVSHAPAILEDLLACGVPLLAVTGTPVHTKPDILSILDGKDEEASAEVEDEIAVLLQLDKKEQSEPPCKSDLRRFGFQRVQPREQ